MASALTAGGVRETALLLDLHEVARALRVSERTVWGLARRGDLRAVRIGRRLLFDPADLRAFIERQKTAGAGAEK
ncbi:MAG: helix-turn-helix domain-containing protein [Planctomycetota bacterium]|nr:helix-turn-helix domain-containing protein [Planctomycetota bacterium]